MSDADNSTETTSIADVMATYLEGARQEYESGVRPPDHAIAGTREERVLTRDGVALRTIVYLPEGEGPWPTLLTRTPYGFIEPIEDVNGREYASRGFAYVVQFCRGTGGSEGDWTPNENERNDGIDTVHWLDAQPWAGNIGIHGVSYMAYTTWIIADQLPASVKGLFVVHYGVDRYLSAYGGGTWRPDVLTGWAMDNAGTKISAGYLESAAYRPQVSVDEDLWGVHLDWYREWITHPEYDDYWRSGTWATLRDIPAQITVPVCVVAGWFDHHLEGTLLGYELLNEATKAKSRLVIGGWDHEMAPAVPAYEPQNAYLNSAALKFTWFDDVLTSTPPTAQITSYVIGEDRWRNVPSWPLPTGESQTYYLNAASGAQAHTANEAPPAEPSTISYTYDPDQPVPSEGGESLLTSANLRGSRLQPEVGARDDVLSFLTEPLESEVAIAGAPGATLFVSSTADDTAFTVKLSEVLPDGRAFNIRSGIRTLSRRHDTTTGTSYEPGAVVELEIALLPVTWTVKRGSRLRLDVSSSDFPQYTPHPNRAGLWSTISTAVTAEQTVHFGPSTLSRFDIPLSPMGEKRV